MGIVTVRNRQKKYQKISDKWRLIIAFSFLFLLGIIILFSFLNQRSIKESDLRSIYVTLKDNPRFEQNTIKSTTYYSIIFPTNEYQKEFEISSFNYDASNKGMLLNNVYLGDKVELKIMKNDFEDLNRANFFIFYNQVYGFSIRGKQLIDLELSNQLRVRDLKMALLILLTMLAFIPYIFIKEPIINKWVAVIAAFIFIIAMSKFYF